MGQLPTVSQTYFFLQTNGKFFCEIFKWISKVFKIKKNSKRYPSIWSMERSLLQTRCKLRLQGESVGEFLKFLSDSKWKI